MAEVERQETEWEGLRLVIEQRPHHWQGFVYDPDECEVLYTAERPDAATERDLPSSISLPFTCSVPLTI